GVEDAIQRQHVDGHGKNGIKSGILVNSCHGGGELRFAVSAMDSMEGVLRWKEIIMLKRALFVRLEEKPDKEKEVLEFLNSGLALANQETQTPMWFALRLGPATFAIFHTFAQGGELQTHFPG